MQSQMTHKPMPRGNAGARVWCVCGQTREEVWVGACGVWRKSLGVAVVVGEPLPKGKRTSDIKDFRSNHRRCHHDNTNEDHPTTGYHMWHRCHRKRILATQHIHRVSLVTLLPSHHCWENAKKYLRCSITIVRWHLVSTRKAGALLGSYKHQWA